MKMRWQPSLQIIPHYESEPLYIGALIASIEKKINEINWKPDLIICSYHGIPKSYFDKGDPYHCYCHKTTRLMKEKFSKVEIQTTFQSRFGPQEWLTPYTDKTLEELPKKGIKNTNKVITVSILDPIKPGLQKEEFLQVLEKKIYNELDLIC